MIKKVSRNVARKARHTRVRKDVSGTSSIPRLNVFRSNSNIFAQIIDDENANTLVSASSIDKELKLENTEETIPTLKEVIKLVDNQVPLLIEIKNGKNAKELAQETYKIMKDYNGRYAIQSFDPFILEWFKNNAPEVIRCQLSCNFEGENNSHLKWYEKFVLKNLITNFKSKPHVIAYDLNNVDNLSLKLLKNKLPLITWTIKDEDDKKLALKKSDNMIFDNIIP